MMAAQDASKEGELAAFLAGIGQFVLLFFLSPLFLLIAFRQCSTQSDRVPILNLRNIDI